MSKNDQKKNMQSWCVFYCRFTLNDLESALRIAKDGDVIFLEDGIYAPNSDNSNNKTAAAAAAAADNEEEKRRRRGRRRRPAFEIKKAVTLVGSSTNKTVVRGSLVKWGAGTAR